MLLDRPLHGAIVFVPQRLNAGGGLVSIVNTDTVPEEVSLHGVEKSAERHKSQRSPLFAREEPRADWKKGLAYRCRGRRIIKQAHAGRRQETKWEISD